MRRGLLLGLALAVARVASAQHTDWLTVTGLEPAAVTEARAAAASFNDRWRDQWRFSRTAEMPVGGRDSAVTSRHRLDIATDQARAAYYVCLQSQTGAIQQHLITSDVRKRNVCPSWWLGGGSPPYDERLGIDVGMALALLPDIRSARADLLSILDRAAAAAPTSDWLAGARVRFALDQGDTARAMAAATTCRANAGWCVALEAYVRYGRGEVAPADSLFQQSLPLLPSAVRCEWTDLRLLLDPAGAAAYSGIRCQDRDSTNARLWWLADPLYSDSGNVRRVEHFARLVRIATHEGDTPSERWAWDDVDGGRAVREMLIRYGWPAYSYWAGVIADRDRFSLEILNSTDPVVIARGIFANAEYPVDRVHTVPAWRAVANPWAAVGADWDVSPPPNARAAPRELNAEWWPQEHMPPASGPLVQLAGYQAGLFRRDSTGLIVVATDLSPADLGAVPGDTVLGLLVLTRGPDDVRMVRYPSTVGSTVVMRAPIPSQPALVGVEYRTRIPGPSARTRFGIEPPPPLSSMAAGEIAISAPVLVHAPASGATLGSDAEHVLPMMYGTTDLVAPGRIGMYWETYGINAGDTVTIEVRIVPREERQTLGERLARLIGRGPPLSEVTIGWTEPAPGHPTTTNIVATHAVQGRSVTLDLSGLAPGSYTLSVQAARPRGMPVVGTRDFTVVSRR